MRPASVWDTDSMRSRFWDPVRMNRPGRASSSTIPWIWESRSGARWISSRIR